MKRLFLVEGVTLTKDRKHYDHYVIAICTSKTRLKAIVERLPIKSGGPFMIYQIQANGFACNPKDGDTMGILDHFHMNNEDDGPESIAFKTWLEEVES